jgi:uncharacterized protein
MHSPAFDDVVDVHVHLFPPEVRADRSAYAAKDAFFGHLYSSPKATMVSVEQLIADMDRDGVARAVIVGWPWQSQALCEAHNSWLVEAVRSNPNRLAGLCVVQPDSGTAALREVDRCLQSGLSGVGELNPEGQVFDLSGLGMENLAAHCSEAGTPLMLHTNEPVGHEYPGKCSSTLGELYRLICRWPELKLVLAHWGGGFPFFELMPEVRRAAKNVFYDSSASPLLYEPRVFKCVIEAAGEGKVLFGSDYPLELYPRRRLGPGFRAFLDDIHHLELQEVAVRQMLSGNARRLFWAREDG